MSKVYYVYLLKDENGTPFYIGISENLKVRIRDHRCRFGKDISHEVLGKFGDFEVGSQEEKRWIRHYISNGISLENKVTYDYEKTCSVRIDSNLVKEIKLNVAQYGGTIRSILERGAGYAMGENICKSKKKKK
jgi:hypothetical protein